MEAKSASELPAGNHWQYEPKWDGFRCLAFRDGEKIELQSKAGRSLTRYFPDIVHALKSLKAPHFVIDGEIVISVDGTLSFEHLLARMNPSSKHVMELARKQPAVFLIFDILVTHDGESLVSIPLRDRRGWKHSRIDSCAGQRESRFLRQQRTVMLLRDGSISWDNPLRE